MTTTAEKTTTAASAMGHDCTGINHILRVLSSTLQFWSQILELLVPTKFTTAKKNQGYWFWTTTEF